MDEVISILIIASGIYVLYAAIRLKNDGQINKSLMISPSQPEDRKNCKDIQGFQKFMFPRTLALSLVTILLGIWELAGKYTGLFEIVSDFALFSELAVLILFFSTFIYYLRSVRKAGKLFF
jgi:hypothetical protein